jgi:hypothetical protein
MANDFKSTDDLSSFFESFIKKGQVTNEAEVVPGFKIKLKALSLGETLSAEAVMNIIENVPPDIINKVRCASILSRSLLEINGIPVENEGDTSEDIRKRRDGLYSNLMKMPAYVIQKAYDFYIKVVIEQSKIYSDGELGEKIENF